METAADTGRDRMLTVAVVGRLMGDALADEAPGASGYPLELHGVSLIDARVGLLAVVVAGRDEGEEEEE